ncbi:hypothetical protein Tco_0591704 [Tanacetum coccineum]
MRWVDRRFKDSFPVVVVEKLCRIVLDCIDEDPSKRPKISRVAGKVLRLYLDSGELADIIHVPNDFTSYFVTSREIRTEIDEEQQTNTDSAAERSEQSRFRQHTSDNRLRQQIQSDSRFRQTQVQSTELHKYKDEQEQMQIQTADNRFRLQIQNKIVVLLNATIDGNKD